MFNDILNNYDLNGQQHEIFINYYVLTAHFSFYHIDRFPIYLKKTPLEKGNQESEIWKFRLKQLRRMEWDPVSIYTTQNTPFEN